MTDESREDISPVCVVTNPLSSAGEIATGDLLRILSAVTPVSLVTPYLDIESTLREEFNVIDLGGVDTGQGSTMPAVGFLLNQLRMSWAVYRRPEPIILFFGGTAYIVPILIGKIVGKTVVLEPRGDVPLTLQLHWERRVPGPVARLLAGVVWGFERLGFVLADCIITYTPGMAEELGLDRFEHKLHPSGARYIDLDRFSPKRPFLERNVVVGFLGRLDEEKGIRNLAAAAKELPARITFRFIGDGELRDWLEKELANEIEAGRVEIEGWVPHAEVPEELSRLQLLVMASAPTEGLPTTIIEAMACGTPAYATPVAGVPDVILHEETGFLMQDSTPAVVADRIEEIIQASDLEQISKRARELIEREYSYDAAIERYAGILNQISR